MATLAPPASVRSTKPAWRLRAIRWHQLLALTGGIALLLWGLSGLLHPIMTSVGPQQAVMLPPQRAIDLAGIRPVAQTLRDAGINQAAAIRFVVGEQENLLQVTVAQDAPRRYFQPETGRELPNHDQAQAIFLARHFAGLPDTPVASVERVTSFSSAYPPVNRLLPVYRVQFATPDALTFHIYTETSSVAAVSNRLKSTLQQAFQWIHTWSFLPRNAEWVRVLLMAALVGSLFALAVTGTLMLILIRRKVCAPGNRGLHRIAGYALALPLLMFSSSGLFHLLQNAGSEPVRTLTLSPPISVPASGFDLPAQWPALSDGIPVNAVSLVTAADGKLLYRLSLAADPKAAANTPATIRNARFEGAAVTGPAVYVEATTGAAWKPGDRELALQLGERFTGLPRASIQSATLITRFGAGYDFRNKRLPVWRLSYGPPLAADIFVDTATGVLADKAPHSGSAERWSFSILHKWDFLRPLGRNAQNIIVSLAVLASLGFMATLGLQMELNRRRRLQSGRNRPPATGSHSAS